MARSKLNPKPYNPHIHSPHSPVSTSKKTQPEGQTSTHSGLGFRVSKESFLEGQGCLVSKLTMGMIKHIRVIGVINLLTEFS